MQYIELIIIVGASIFALILTIYHLTSRFNSRLSRLFAIITLCVSLVYALLFVQLLQIKTPFLFLLGKIYYALLIITAQAFFHVMQIFPGGSTRKKIIAVSITSLPGLILAFITITTNWIIYDETYLNNLLHISPGTLNDIYIIILLMYIAGALLITIIKSITAKNRVFRNQMRWLLLGFFVSAITITIFSITLPLLFDSAILKNIGHALGISYILAIMSFAFVDIISLDLKKFYIRTIYMVIFFSILYIPVVLALHYGPLFFPKHNLAVAGVSILLFIYLAIFFSKIRPWLESLFQWDYRNMARSFNETFQKINQLPISSDRNEFWSQFYENSIGTLAKKYQIDFVHFFLNNRSEKKFDRVFVSGENIPISSISYDDPVIKSIRPDSGIINYMIIDFDASYSLYSKNLKNFFDEHKIELMIPFFDYDRECTGVLFLGGLNRTESFSKAFLSVLDLFRIQFQRQLLNALILEDVKARQIIEHDKMVAKSIKRKILPAAIEQIEGIRISSLHISNSQFGGDYFDSLLSGDRLILFIADTSYSDIESGILSLELYTVLHTPSKFLDSPEKIVNMMNWVIATSRFSNRYASAFCLSCSQEGDIEYACAAFNPLIIFDPVASAFSSHESQGIPIGVDREFMYEKTSIQSAHGSIGILYSTGLVTAMNPAGDAYSIDRLKNIIMNKHDEQPSSLTRLLYEDVLDFMQEKKQINDITIIVFKITGK